ncbi:Gfo/Idh/MocA family protein [Micromonospora profundi]|uniref:Gfo/Idh/MocA family oxidoreductase n=1 Tax=Micromonospora profundi TaxID=1420889 RepID=A0AAJ6HQW6_9ACTN|nr:Gfo/Idh/MocA family oxidoreductase [Micromonospora profundi]WLS43368.1 Gfo/Idh/MocA family oxidoreductase [Micromonospora profundi]
MNHVPVPVRLGVLGCADIAWRKLLPAAAAEPGLRTVAIAGRDPARTDRFAARFGCAAVNRYEALLERSDVEAVYLPLPIGLRHRWAGAALAAGKHVLAEKPMVGTEKQTADLVSQAAERGLTLMENTAFLLHGQHAAVRRAYAAGEIGELRAFSSVFGIPPLPNGDIRYRPDLGGGALLDVGFYPLRAARHFVGPDLRVVGADLRTGPSGVDVAGTVLLGGPNQVAVQVGFGFEHFYRSGYELWGSTGELRLERAFTPPPDHRPVLGLRQQDRRESRTLPAEDQFAALVRTFVAAVSGEHDLSGHHAEMLGHARLVDAIRRAAGQGEP